MSFDIFSMNSFSWIRDVESLLIYNLNEDANHRNKIDFFIKLLSFFPHSSNLIHGMCH